MTIDQRRVFRETLKEALDEYQPGWDVRRHTGSWEMRHHEQWEQNRRLGVWVDTLRRWVDGDHFPRVKKFEGFLDNAEFPTDVRESLFRLYHDARTTKPSKETGQPTTQDDVVIVIGTPMISPSKTFVGRNQGAAQLREWLNGDATVLSIVGRSGIGKTTLACQVLDAEIDSGDNLDAIVYVPAQNGRTLAERIFLHCAEIQDEDLLQKTWASPSSLQHKLDALALALRDLNVMVFVDEIEHLLDAEGRVVDESLTTLIAWVGRPETPLKLLVTSQVEIQLPLDVRPRQQMLSLTAGLDVAEGIQLLRTLDPNGVCGLRDSDEQQLAQIVLSVHGLPRALEVIAGILYHNRLTSLDDIIQRFETFEDMQTVLAEGYRHLEPIARTAVDALAVLRHPARPEVVVTVMERERGVVMPTLHQLIRAHLIDADRSTGEVRLLPIEADFAYRQLDAATRRHLERRAAEYYQEHFQSRATWRSVEDVEPYLRAFDHWLRGERPDAATEIVLTSDLCDFLVSGGHIQRLIAMYEQLLPVLDDPRTEAMLYHQLGDTYWLAGQFEQAAECFERTIDMARAIDDVALIGQGLMGLGHLNRSWSRYEAALEAYELALEDAEDLADKALICQIELNIGMSHHQLGESERALSHVHHARRLARQIGDPEIEGRVYLYLAKISQHLGEFQQSQEYLQIALDIVERTGNHRLETLVYQQLGHVHSDLGLLEESRQAFQHAFTLAETLGSLQAHAASLCGLGRVHWLQGDHQTGRRSLAEGLDIANRIGDRQVEGDAWYASLLVYLGSDELERAELAVHHLLEIAGATRNRVEWQAWYTAISAYYLQSGNREQAQTMIQMALAYPAIRHHYHALVVHGMIKLQQGDKDGARIAFNKALDAAKSPKIHKMVMPHYTHGLACVGLALVDDDKAADWINAAQQAYLQARWLCDAPGLIGEARFWLRLLQQDDQLPQTLLDASAVS